MKKETTKKKVKSQILNVIDEIKKPLELFDHLNNLTINKVELDVKDDLQTKNYSQYTINRFVSMCDLYLPMVNEINQYKYSDKIHNQYYLAMLPKRKQFFKYITKEKDNMKESKENIVKYFSVGIREAEQYLEILTKEQIEEINNKFKGGKI